MFEHFQQTNLPSQLLVRSASNEEMSSRVFVSRLCFALLQLIKTDPGAAVLYLTSDSYVIASPQRWKQHVYVQYSGSNKNNFYANEAAVLWVLNGVFNGGVLSGDAAVRSFNSSALSPPCFPLIT